jgi:hypothetical protein
MIARRAAVLATLALCVFLVSPVPLHGLGLLPVIALAALDAVLLAATGGLAYARTRRLDERQVALRDLAYRRGYRLLGLGIVLAVIVWFVAAGIVEIAIGPSGRLSQVDSGLSGRLLVAIAELAVMLPTMVVAWSARNGGGRLTPLPGLAVPAVAVAWLVVVAWTPVQAATVSRSFSITGSMASGSTCRHFVAGRIVGGGFGATVGMRVEVCWNGRTAFVVGDPDLPLPASVDGETAATDLTACGADNLEDFAAVTGTTCTATVDADGTLHYAVRARVVPLALPIGARDVTMELVVTPDGRVLRRP